MFRGQILSERYQIQRAIGGGGMANVYLARDIILERDVAIKVLRMEYANDEEFIDRFRREAQSTIHLSHPNIVSIFDVGEEEEENIYYIVMEYVKGMTLKEYIQMYSPLPVDEAIDIMSQVTSAISHAHQNGIIHRDIKPQNILIDHNGKVKVTDFGIAMALSGTSITQTNSVLGSVHYLSPEQARGGTAIKKSDVYSLGIVFFELLTGRLPFSGDTAVSIALKHLQSDTPSVRRWNPDIPQSVENIVLKATAKNPFHRYDNVNQMEEDLATALLPDRLHEKRFTPPIEEGEETKAIPIITNHDQLNENDDTIVRQKAEESKPQPKKKNKKAFIWVLSIASMLIIAGILALFVLPKWLMPDEVEIPQDVIGMTADGATELLEDLGLNVKVEEMNHDEIEPEIVITTDPEPGTVVREESTVTIFKSIGQEPVEFKNYVGDQFETTKAILLQAGYVDVKKQERHSDEYDVGEIIEHIYPSEGAKIIPSETTVEFWVSAGPAKVKVPNYSGMTIEEINEYNEKNELSILLNVIDEFHNTTPEGQVFKQEPSFGTEINKGEEVTVYISKGREPQPKQVEYTVTYNEIHEWAQMNLPPPNVEEGQDEGNLENPEPVVYEMTLYIEDMYNDFTSPMMTTMLREQDSKSFRLTIEPNSEGRYKIMVNDKVYKEEVVPYPEGGDA